MEQSTVQPEEDRRSGGQRDLVSPVAAAALAVVVFAAGWARHRAYRSGFDLAIFDQAAWQLSEGRDHISIVERRVLADHFSPVLYAFALPYRLVASPAWLLGAQALALGATVFPVRALARHLGASLRVATLLVVASAPLLSAGIFDFHPSTLAVPLLAWAVLAAVQDRPGMAVAAAAGVFVCRADLGIVLIALAVVAGRRSRPVLGLTGLASIVAGALLPGRFGETSGWEPHFGHLGDRPVDAVLAPWKVLGHLFSPGSIAPFVVWILAGGVLVLLRPRWLLALLVAGAPVLLSRWLGTELPWYHYGAPMAPIAIGGTLVALAEPAPGWLGTARRARAPVVGVIVGLLIGSPLAPGAPDSIRLWSAVRPDPRVDAEGAVASVAEGEAVSAHDNLLPHLSQREEVYLFPVPFGIQRNYYADGSEPDLDRYPPGHVDALVGLDGLIDPADVEGYEIAARPRGFVVFRPVDP